MTLWKVIGHGSRMVCRLWVFTVGVVTMLNLGPVAATAASMLLSLAVYAVAFGWKFAAGFVMLLLVHEMGHFIAARVVGLHSSPPVFVPFVGAVINLRQPPYNAKMEANVAIGGPALGTLSALICLVFYLWSNSPLMLVLAYTACVLNLFNLIPCAPLDGGKIADAISSKIWWTGSVVTGVLFYFTHNFFILVIFFYSLLRLWKGENGDGDGRYYHLSVRQRIKVALWYFGLLAVLGITTVYLMDMLH